MFVSFGWIDSKCFGFFVSFEIDLHKRKESYEGDGIFEVFEKGKRRCEKCLIWIDNDLREDCLEKF